MVEATPFSAWESFYVIIGSSAAALTGLQFVVVVLGAEARSIGPEVGAFGTPTVVHFCAVLLMSAILSVPWRAVSHAGLSLAAVGVANRVHGGRHPAGPPADALRTGAGRLAVALRLSAHRVRDAAGGGARSPAGPSDVPLMDWRDGAALAVHRDSQRLVRRHLHRHATAAAPGG